MKYLIIPILAFTVSCASLQSPFKPITQINPDTLLTILGGLQDTVIEANNRKELSDNSTRSIVTFVVNSAKIIKTSPTNIDWKSVVGTALGQLLKDLPIADTNRFSSTFNIIRSGLK